MFSGQVMCSGEAWLRNRDARPPHKAFLPLGGWLQQNRYRQQRVGKGTECTDWPKTFWGKGRGRGWSGTQSVGWRQWWQKEFRVSFAYLVTRPPRPQAPRKTSQPIRAAFPREPIRREKIVLPGTQLLFPFT